MFLQLLNSYYVDFSIQGRIDQSYYIRPGEFRKWIEQGELRPEPQDTLPDAEFGTLYGAKPISKIFCISVAIFLASSCNQAAALDFGDLNPFPEPKELTALQQCNAEANQRYFSLGQLPSVEAEHAALIAYSESSNALSYAQDAYYKASRLVRHPGYTKKAQSQIVITHP
ncbi:hypothetical protein IMCC20628_03724 [Hoeflea sp. IMCC20628]|nr:hypothetical protein IMCC20628_03724 [Hoeflea sp. IMCC20628]